MKVVRKMGICTAFVLVALLLSHAGTTGTPAFGQYGGPPDGQYGLPEDQYDSPPPSTVPIPDDQYGTPPEERTDREDDTGGSNEGTTTIDGGEGTDDEAAPEARTPDRPSAADPNTLSGLLDGFLVDSIIFLAVLSLITTLILLAERFMGRPGL
jgi:hypothetical protein